MLELANPNPGDALPQGDVVFSGLAFDPGASSGNGISRVDLFIGSRDSGGTLIGSVVPGTISDPRAWQVESTLPSNSTGGHDFVAYALSSVTGQETSVTVPVFIGSAPTPTPTGTGATPVALSETVVSTCRASTALGLVRLPPAHAAPNLSLGNPSSGDVLSTGDMLVQGLAWDPEAGAGTGVDSVELFLGNRDTGGIFLGRGMPGTSDNARAFVVKASIPNTETGGHDFVAYAHSSVTGAESMLSVPVYIGAPPTATPRPKS